MILTPTTCVYIVGKRDGSFDTKSLRSYHDALNGGMNPDEVVVTTDLEEARQHRVKYEAITKINAKLEGMNDIGCTMVLDGIDELLTAAVSRLGKRV